MAQALVFTSKAAKTSNSPGSGLLSGNLNISLLESEEKDEERGTILIKEVATNYRQACNNK